MNIRQFSLAILVSALPVFAQSTLSLNSGDFLSAEKVTKEGETLLKVKLSKSGKAKIRKLNKEYVNRSVHIELPGVSSDLKFRGPIKGDSMEMGPYSQQEAQNIVLELNHKK